VPGAASLDIGALQRQLTTEFTGRGDRLVYLPTVESTNTLAMQLAFERPEEGLVVLTDSQTAGKGRQGHRWVDVYGCNVLSSIILRPGFPPHLLVMVASLAVVDSIFETCGVRATIKWPNDVLVGDRKVAGILIETSRDPWARMVAIVGIGINVNGQMQELFREFASEASLIANATTLETECGYQVSRETFIAHLLRHIENDYLALQQEAVGANSVAKPPYGPCARLLRERWKGQLSTLGRTVSVQQGDSVISGFAENVDESGELLLRSLSGEMVSITWGTLEYSTR
jgi:BirA family transcriptional regulator, biotin operon repressor / biotin---[acetyl-CoA-carboxylase] ligase